MINRPIAYFDVFTVSGAKLPTTPGSPLMADSVRLSDAWGKDDLTKRLTNLEKAHGPLYVKHLGLGYLDMFVGGKLLNAQAGLDQIERAAVANAVAEVTK